MDMSRSGDGSVQGTSKCTQAEGQREQCRLSAITLLCPVHSFVSTPHAQVPNRPSQAIPGELEE